MIRKVSCVLIIVLLSVSAFAASKSGVSIESWFKPGNLAANVGISYNGFGLGAGGGLELILTEFKIADIIPLQIGVAGRGFVNPLSVWGFTFGAGGLVTLHWSVKSLNIADLKFLNNVDISIGLGIGFTVIPGWPDYSGYGYYVWNPSGLGFWTEETASYFLNDNLALFANYQWYKDLSGGTFGILFKL